jgi:hypothetical protein
MVGSGETQCYFSRLSPPPPPPIGRNKKHSCPFIQLKCALSSVQRSQGSSIIRYSDLAILLHYDFGPGQMPFYQCCGSGSVINLPPGSRSVIQNYWSSSGSGSRYESIRNTTHFLAQKDPDFDYELCTQV